MGDEDKSMLWSFPVFLDYHDSNAGTKLIEQNLTLHKKAKLWWHFNGTNQVFIFGGIKVSILKSFQFWEHVDILGPSRFPRREQKAICLFWVVYQKEKAVDWDSEARNEIWYGEQRMLEKSQCQWQFLSTLIIRISWAKRKAKLFETKSLVQLRDWSLKPVQKY